MLAPKSDAIINNLGTMPHLRVTAFKDMDISNRRLTEFSCFKVDISDELRESLLLNFFGIVPGIVGSVRTTADEVICDNTIAMDFSDYGYILYAKYKSKEQKIELFSVNNDFLNSLIILHNYFILNPSYLQNKYDPELKYKYLKDVFIQHRFVGLVNKSYKQLEETILGCAPLSINKVTVNSMLIGANRKYALYDSRHQFSEEFINKYLAHRQQPSLIVCSNGIGFIYNPQYSTVLTLNHLICADAVSSFIE